MGTETDGSVTSPAAACGLVGLKPTIGLVSRTGIIPISASQDTAGPMTRTVADAALLLTVMAGADPSDPATTAPHPLRPTAPVDYTRALDPKALVGARLGIPRTGWFGIDAHMDAIGVAAIARLRELGAVIIDPIELVAPPELSTAELEVMLTELRVQLEAYLGGRGADTHVRNLADVIAFNRNHAETELALFGQQLFEQAEAKGDLTSQAYKDARATCLRIARTEGIDRMMDAHALDAVVLPTQGPAWLIDPVGGDASVLACTTLPAVAGYPHITVPAGQYRELPVGLSLFGRPYAEAKLLGYAFAYEQATRLRRRPTYLPTVPA